MKKINQNSFYYIPVYLCFYLHDYYLKVTKKVKKILIIHLPKKSFLTNVSVNITT